jgi:hypothetical protein
MVGLLHQVKLSSIAVKCRGSLLDGDFVLLNLKVYLTPLDFSTPDPKQMRHLLWTSPSSTMANPVIVNSISNVGACSDAKHCGVSDNLLC